MWHFSLIIGYHYLYYENSKESFNIWAQHFLALAADSEISSIPFEKLFVSLNIFRRSEVRPWRIEIRALFLLIIYIFSLIYFKSTIGQKCFSISYTDLTLQKSKLLIIVWVVGQYVREKCIRRGTLFFEPNAKPVIKFIKCMTFYWQLCTIVYFLWVIGQDTNQFLFEEWLLGIHVVRSNFTKAGIFIPLIVGLLQDLLTNKRRVDR